MFDLRRFGRLAAVQWAEHRREYLWFFGIGIAVHACMWLLLTEAGKRMDMYQLHDQGRLYYGGYLLTSLIFAGRHFAIFARPDAALTYLMRPGSTIEKFVLAFLVVAVAYPLAYTFAFQVCHLPGYALAATAPSPPGLLFYSRDFGPFMPFAGDNPLEEASAFLGVCTLQAMVLAGMLYFRRFAALKTIVSLFAILVIALPLIQTLSGAHPEKLLPGSDSLPIGNGVRAWLWVLWIGVPALFWCSVYGFLRERDIA
ncbi:hypothetical protein ACQQ2N_17760 [Dokdonella sp. MW10]|uniref:hypothetical protein n=1 Tax=Dokdonella sp. MW10 TaxID=2992926 RepID=UPI003F7D652F